MSIKIPMTGGVNLLRDPRKIRDDELVLALNTVPIRPGIIGKRPGVGPLSRAATLYLTPLGVYIPPFSGALALVVTRQVGTPSNTLPGLVLNNGAFVSFGSFGCVTARRPTVVAFGNKGYIFPGYPAAAPGMVYDQSFAVIGAPAPPVVVWADQNGAPALQSVPTVPNAVACYHSRFCYANFGPGFENHLFMADPYQPLAIGPNALTSNSVIIGGHEGDRIVALVEVMATAVGAPLATVLLILKENSAYILSGEIPTIAAPTVFAGLQIERMNINAGCASADTICKTPYGLFWAGPDDVWFWPTGQVPIRVGTKIRPALARTPANLRYKWYATYSGGFYRLAIFGDGQGPTDDAPLMDQWWLDLRDGPPQGAKGDLDEAHEVAQWWGPQQYQITQPIDLTRANAGDRNGGGYGTGLGYTGTYHAVLDQRAGAAARLIGVEFLALYLSLNPEVGLVVYDTPSPRDITCAVLPGGTAWQAAHTYALGDLVVPSDHTNWNGHYYIVSGAGTSGAVEPTWPTGAQSTVVKDGVTYQENGTGYPAGGVNGTEILFKVTTKEYDLDDPMVDKIFKGLEMNVTTDKIASIAIDAIMDAGGAVDTQAVVTDSPGGLRVNQGQLDLNRGAGVSQSIVSRPDPSTRDVGKTLQFSIYDQPGYVIGPLNNVIVAFAGAIFNPRVITLAQGIYNKVDLCTLITNALNAQASGVTWNVFPNGTFDGTSFEPRLHTDGAATVVFAPATGITAAQQASCQNVFALLGFDVSANIVFVGAGDAWADVSAPPSGISSVEFGGMNALVGVLPRRPS